MNRLFLTAVAGGLLVMASCSQEEITKQKPVINNEGFPISFRAGVSTRVNPDLDYTSTPATFYVTAFPENHKAREDGSIPNALFMDEPFYQMGSNLYASTSSHKWPTQQEAKQVEFFAYAPSLEEIQQAAITQLNANDAQYPTLVQNYKDNIQFFNLCSDKVPLDPIGQEEGTFAGIDLFKGFKLGRFYVATDISKQVDFITAHIAAPTPESQDEAKIGTELNFKHQLSNIELRAFSANKDFNIEVAGVRLGRPYTGAAIFNFCDANGNVENAEGGQWGISKNPQRLPVEYIYGEGDEIYRMGVFNNMTSDQQVLSTPAHTTPERALSIMGKAGNAMVLPTKNGAWAGENNPWIAPKYSSSDSSGDPDTEKNPHPWSADKESGDMYFSILLRVTLKPKGTDLTSQQIYPYGNNTTMNVVYIEKDKTSNKVVGRVPNKSVIPGPNNEIVEFGWAAVPVSVNWERGKKYIYTLDFTKGVGIQDPEDPKPGAPIIGDGITFSVSVVSWDEGNSNSNPYPVPK